MYHIPSLFFFVFRNTFFLHHVQMWVCTSLHVRFCHCTFFTQNTSMCMCAGVCVCVSSSARELVGERERGGERESVREGASAERESPPSRLLPYLQLADRIL